MNVVRRDPQAPVLTPRVARVPRHRSDYVLGTQHIGYSVVGFSKGPSCVTAMGMIRVTQ